MISRTVRVYFDSLEAAADGLVLVLEDCRETSHEYSFGGLHVEQVLQSGLLLTGDVDEVVDKLISLPGTTRHDE